MQSSSNSSNTSPNSKANNSLQTEQEVQSETIIAEKTTQNLEAKQNKTTRGRKRKQNTQILDLDAATTSSSMEIPFDNDPNEADNDEVETLFASKKQKTEVEKNVKKLNEAQSAYIIALYGKYGDNGWDKILNDDTVKQWCPTNVSKDVFKKKLKDHINYIRTKKNKTISPPNNLRKSIVNTIAKDMEQNNNTIEEEIQDFETDLNLSQDPNAHNITTPPLTPSFQILHNKDKELFSSAVASTSISSQTDFQQVINNLEERKKTAKEHITQKVKEKNTIIEDIRLQQHERKENESVKLMAMQYFAENMKVMQLQNSLLLQQLQQNNVIFMKTVEKFFGNLGNETINTSNSNININSSNGSIIGSNNNESN